MADDGRDDRALRESRVTDARPSVVLIAGPAGAGKTTIAARIAQHSDWIHLSEDEHWTRVKVGRPPGELRTTEEQDVVQREVIDRMADAVAKGAHVALELILYEDPPRPLQQYQRALDARRLAYATRVLRPSVDELLRRIATRGRSIEVALPDLRAGIEHQVGVLSSTHIDRDWVINNENLSVDELYDRHFRSLVE
ncbi:MAG: hypothetical protein QOD30_1519 [Actinomycetota bacterium]|nr:hypothetical protein [Actinomycetota bacterium]